MFDYILGRYKKEIYYNNKITNWTDKLSLDEENSFSSSADLTESQNTDTKSYDKECEKYHSIDRRYYVGLLICVVIFVLNISVYYIFDEANFGITLIVSLLCASYTVIFIFKNNARSKEQNNCSYKFVRKYRMLYLKELLSSLQLNNKDSIEWLISKSEDKIKDMKNKSISIPFVSSIFSLGLFPLIQYVMELIIDPLETDEKIWYGIAGIILLVYLIIVITAAYWCLSTNVGNKIQIINTFKEDMEYLVLLEKSEALKAGKSIEDKTKEEKQNSWISAFVITQFGGMYDNLYNEVIKLICEKREIIPIRVDEISVSSLILNDVCKRIEKSDIVIADISENNPNVFYELGYAYALKKHIILLCENTKREILPFDTRGYRILNYGKSLIEKSFLEKEFEIYIDEILKKMQ